MQENNCLSDSEIDLFISENNLIQDLVKYMDDFCYAYNIISKQEPKDGETVYLSETEKINFTFTEIKDKVMHLCKEVVSNNPRSY